MDEHAIGFSQGSLSRFAETNSSLQQYNNEEVFSPLDSRNSNEELEKTTYSQKEFDDLKKHVKDLEQQLDASYQLVDQLEKVQQANDEVVADLKRQLKYHQLASSCEQKINAASSRKTTLLEAKRSANIMPILTSYIFPQKKFLGPEDLDDFSDGKIPKEIMKRLNVPVDDMASFWSVNKTAVKRMFEQYRSGAQQQMKVNLLEGIVWVIAQISALESVCCKV